MKSLLGTVIQYLPPNAQNTGQTQQNPKCPPWATKWSPRPTITRRPTTIGRPTPRLSRL